MELNDLIIDLRGKSAWHPIFEINFRCVGYNVTHIVTQLVYPLLTISNRRVYKAEQPSFSLHAA